MSLISWLIENGGKYATRHFAKALIAEDGLGSRLKEAIEKWNEGLDENERLSHPDSIFIHDERPDRPLPKEVLHRFDKNQIPTADEWLQSLIRQWRWVRTTKQSDERAAFFNIDESVAINRLSLLADRLVQVCNNDDKLFKTQALNDLTELKSQNESADQKLDMVLRNQDELKHAFLSKLITTQNENGGLENRKGAFQGKIDLAAAFNRLDPNRAIEELESLKQDNWNAMNPHERFRIYANLGHANETRGELQTAAEYFIKCANYDVSPQARSLQAIGRLMQGRSDEAFMSAKEILAEHADCTFARSIWVQTHPSDISTINLVDQIPPEQLKDAEVAHAIAVRAAKEDDFNLAVSYIRIALDNAPKNADVQEAFASIVLEQLNHLAIQQNSLTPVTRDSTLTIEAQKCLKAVEGKTSYPRDLARIKFKLGMIARFQNDLPEAEQYFKDSYTLSPSSVDYGRQYAITLSDRGETGKAIDVAETVRKNDTTGTLDALTAMWYLERREGLDVTTASEILKDLLGNSSRTQSVHSRLESLSSLMYAFHCQKQYLEAREFVGRLPSDFLPEAAICIVLSQLERFAGNAEIAQSLAKKANTSLSDGDDRSIVQKVAIGLMRTELWTEALVLWKRLVTPQFLCVNTNDAIRCAWLAGDDSYLLDFCETSLQNGFHDKNILHCYLDKLAEYSSHRKGQEVIVKALSNSVDEVLKRELRARLVDLCTTLDDFELWNSHEGPLPEIDEVSARMGYAVSRLLSKTGSFLERIKYCYELLRKHFDSPWAHKAIIVAFLDSAGDPRFEPPNQAGNGAAIQWTEGVSNEPKTIIIEDDLVPDAKLHEVTSTHPLAKSFAGHRVGDEVILQSGPFGDTKGKIVSLVNKYVYRFNNSAHEWGTRFPDEPFIWRLEAQRNQNGDLDVDPILKVFEKRRGFVHGCEALYRGSFMAASQFAAAMDLTVPEAMAHICLSKDLPLRSRYEHCIALKDETAIRKIVLDSTSLTTLYLANCWDIVELLPDRPVVTQGTIDELRQSQFKSGRQSVALEGGVPISNERMSLSQFIGKVVAWCEIVDGIALSKISKDQRQELVSIVGRTIAETIAYAASCNGTVWTDDANVGRLSERDFGVMSTSTVEVVKRFAESKRLSDRTHNAIMVRLMKMNYLPTVIGRAMMCDIGRAEQWSISDDDSTMSILAYLTKRYFNTREVVQNLQIVLPPICIETSSFRRDGIIGGLVEMLGTRPDGSRIVNELAKNPIAFCGLDVPTAKYLSGHLPIVWSKAIGKTVQV